MVHIRHTTHKSTRGHLTVGQLAPYSTARQQEESIEPQQEESAKPLLTVIKYIYLLPTYLHFIQDIEDRYLLLTSSTSFVDLLF
jgi:hypothetical protein